VRATSGRRAAATTPPGATSAGSSYGDSMTQVRYLPTGTGFSEYGRYKSDGQGPGFNLKDTQA
jgi:hypothetical protein